MNKNTGNFTWNMKWISHFESPWSIIEKIKFFNCILSRDFINFFGEDRNTNHIKDEYKNLLSLSKLNDQLFKEKFDFSLKAHNQKIIKLILSPFHDGIQKQEKYFQEKLYFCPICIKNGFHSIFHQFKLLNNCPFHNVELVTQCHSCLKNNFQMAMAKSYTLMLDSDYTPFKCACGRLLLSEDINLTSYSYQPTKHDIIIDDFKKWISLTSYQKSIISNYRFIKHDDIPLNNHFLTKCLATLNDSIDDSANSKISGEFNIHFSHIKSHLEVNSPIDSINSKQKNELSSLIYDSSFPIMNALARRIRKKVNKNHKYCVIKMKKQMVNTQNGKTCFCPVAAAYLKWRLCVQDFKIISEIDNYGHFDKNLNRSDIRYASNIDIQILKQFRQDIKELVYEDKVLNLSVMNWFLNKAMVQLAINHFNNLLIAFTENTTTNPHQFLYNNFRNFIFSDKSQFKFDWYGEEVLIDISDYDKYCPYKLSKKIKKDEISYPSLLMDRLDKMNLF